MNTKQIAYSALTSALFFTLPTIAQAADFGGDCCADLEERVAVLEATSARKGNRTIKLKIYGRVNKALLFWDNGQDSDVYNVDNDSSIGRIGVRGKANINSQWSAGYRIELSVTSAESDRVDAGHEIPGKNDANGDDGDGGRIEIRRNEMFIKNKTFGSITWGRTHHGMYHTAKADLSGTHLVGRNDGLRYIEDFVIINSNGSVNQNTDWDDIFAGDFDLSRDDVIRYDTPTIAGFKVSASWGEDDEYSVGVFYAGEFGDIKIAAAAGFGIDEEGDRQEILNGSGSIMHTPTGLFLTGSYATREDDDTGDEEETYQIKGGVKQSWNSFGTTAVYGEYIGTDVDTHGEGEIWGLGVVQKIDVASMELYAGYRHYEADLDSGVATEDFQTVITGARIKF